VIIGIPALSNGRNVEFQQFQPEHCCPSYMWRLAPRRPGPAGSVGSWESQPDRSFDQFSPPKITSWVSAPVERTTSRSCRIPAVCHPGFVNVWKQPFSQQSHEMSWGSLYRSKITLLSFRKV
jgi:hypothetical protein